MSMSTLASTSSTSTSTSISTSTSWRCDVDVDIDVNVDVNIDVEVDVDIALDVGGDINIETHACVHVNVSIDVDVDDCVLCSALFLFGLLSLLSVLSCALLIGRSYPLLFSFFCYPRPPRGQGRHVGAVTLCSFHSSVNPDLLKAKVSHSYKPKPAI